MASRMDVGSVVFRHLPYLCPVAARKKESPSESKHQRPCCGTEMRRRRQRPPLDVGMRSREPTGAGHGRHPAKSSRSQHRPLSGTSRRTDQCYPKLKVARRTYGRPGPPAPSSSVTEQDRPAATAGGPLGPGTRGSPQRLTNRRNAAKGWER